MFWRTVVRTDENVKVKKQEQPSGTIAGRDGQAHDLNASIRQQIDAGASFSGQETNHFWFNEGGADFNEKSGVSGLAHNGDSRAFALFDYDRDGYSDIALVNANKPFVQLFRNRIGDRATVAGDAQKGGVIALNLVGGNHTAQPSTEWAPRDGYGAKLLVEVSGRELLRELRCGEGFASQNSATMLVGLGSGVRTADKVTVIWPSGRTQSTHDVASGTRLTVYENIAHAPAGEPFVASAYAPVPSRPESGHEEFLSSAGRSYTFAADRAGDADLRVYVSTFTGCTNCTKAIPRLAKIKDEFGDRVALLGVPALPITEESEAKWSAYLNKYRPAYEVQVGSDYAHFESLRSIVMEELALSGPDKVGTPATLVTDAHGRVLRALNGAVPSISELKHVLHELEGHDDAHASAAPPPAEGSTHVTAPGGE